MIYSEIIYSEMERKVIELLQGDIPLTPRPYKRLARELGVTEEEVVACIKKLCDERIIKRLAGILRHRKAGYNFNAMVVWQVSAGQADDKGGILASFPEVSHCYRRQTPKDFPYQLFTMVHAKNKEHFSGILKNMRSRSGLQNYLVLESIEELKKSSMIYFA
ncbi:MAG: Lrp/AsnC family transcriptional regulator [Syntrophomonadaceae bacterium]|jgi:DNA-binding Lrp family transcriptional regulator|nr:Lrp/AsnC family transcriptional regulator [Syntrophomonadaceae bacterium]